MFPGKDAKDEEEAAKAAAAFETEVTKTLYPKKPPVPISKTPQWKVAFEPVVPESFPNEIEPISLDFGDLSQRGARAGDRCLLLSSPAGAMAVASVIVEGEAWKKETVLNAVSLKHGKAIGKRLPFLVSPKDISPDGKLLAAACSLGDGASRAENYLAILRIDNASFEATAVFIPFDGLPTNAMRREKLGVKCARWLDDHRLLLSSSEPLVLLLDITTGKVPYGIKLEGFDREFNLTPDRQYLTISNGNYMAVFEAETGAQRGFLDATALAEGNPPRGKMSANVCFSPTGRLFAAGTASGVHVWDFTKGAFLKTIPCQMHYGHEVTWIDNRFLFKIDRLLDAKTGTECLDYNFDLGSVKKFTSAAGQLVYLIDDRMFNPTSSTLVAANPVPENIEEMFKKAEQNNERVMGPGDSVSVRIDVRLGEPEKRKVFEHFSQQIAANGWTLALPGTAPYELAIVMGPLGEEVTMKLSGSGLNIPSDPGLAQTKFRPYPESVTITKDGKRIWGLGRTVMPPGAFKSAAEFEPAVREAMREKPDFFLKTTFPKIITRGDAGSVRGSAQITAAGITF